MRPLRSYRAWVNEIAPDIRRHVQVGRLTARNAEAVDPDNPLGQSIGQVNRAEQAEHMAAPTNAANAKKVLANSEPSTHGSRLPTPCCAPKRQLSEMYRS